MSVIQRMGEVGRCGLGLFPCEQEEEIMFQQQLKKDQGPKSTQRAFLVHFLEEEGSLKDGFLL